jgi:hypothetical protein
VGVVVVEKAEVEGVVPEAVVHGEAAEKVIKLDALHRQDFVGMEEMVVHLVLAVEVVVVVLQLMVVALTAV